MTVRVRTAAGLKQVANASVRTSGGLKSIQNGYVRTAAGLKQFFSKFAVGASPASGVVVKGNSATTTSFTTRAVTAIAAGTVGAVTYAWSQVDGDAITIDDPDAASTTFSGAVGPGAALDGHFKCNVTDAAGHSADTDPVSVSILNLYGGLA